VLTLEKLKNLPEDQQKALFKKISAVRKKSKVTNYSATYGVGKAKLARTTGMSEVEAERLLEAFWKLNWSVRAVADKTIVRKIGGQMWLYNPVSRFWVSLRYERDLFSSLNQSTGVFCFDSWLAQCWAMGIKGVGQFHDETVVPLKKGNNQVVYDKMKLAIHKVNQALNLNVPLDVDPKFGLRYSEVH
jgi:DNA polymerase I-like protein with 3'-5' exonuclease and polymerase domains